MFLVVVVADNGDHLVLDLITYKIMLERQYWLNQNSMLRLCRTDQTSRVSIKFPSSTIKMDIFQNSEEFPTCEVFTNYDNQVVFKRKKIDVCLVDIICESFLVLQKLLLILVQVAENSGY